MTVMCEVDWSAREIKFGKSIVIIRLSKKEAEIATFIAGVIL